MCTWLVLCCISSNNRLNPCELMAATRSSNRQMLSLTPMLWKNHSCKRKCFVAKSFLYLFALYDSRLFRFLSVTSICCFYVILQQDIMLILIISYWLKPVVRDQTFWQTRITDTFMDIRNSSFVKPADSGHTSIRNRKELQCCRQMNKPWIIENKRPETSFMLVVCLVNS